MDVAALDLGYGAGPRFFLEFVRADGTRHRESLAACVTARFEDMSHQGDAAPDNIKSWAAFAETRPMMGRNQ